MTIRLFLDYKNIRFIFIDYKNIRLIFFDFKNKRLLRAIRTEQSGIKPYETYVLIV